MFNTFAFNKVAFNKRATTAATPPPHVILEASYEVDTQPVNRAFVVGEDLSGGSVIASAITQGEVDLVGERLEVHHELSAVTAIVAGNVAAAVLGKNRLDGNKGSITIPPHCGLELWDVVNIVDAGANQSGDYRVSGYTLEYDIVRFCWYQDVDLSAP